MNTANPGESYSVEWVTIEEPNPLTDTVRVEAQSKGAAIFDRTEGTWPAAGFPAYAEGSPFLRTSSTFSAKTSTSSGRV